VCASGDSRGTRCPIEQRSTLAHEHLPRDVTLTRLRSAACWMRSRWLFSRRERDMRGVGLELFA
jgi:hypothetical protein